MHLLTTSNSVLYPRPQAGLLGWSGNRRDVQPSGGGLNMEKVTKAKRAAPFQVFDMITIDMKAIKTTTPDRRIAG